jgi:hypothetical protein
MKTDSWTRLDTVIIVVVSIVMLVIAGLSVKFKERGRLQVASYGSDRQCYPRPYKHGQPTCNMADARHPIAAD